MLNRNSILTVVERLNRYYRSEAIPVPFRITDYHDHIIVSFLEQSLWRNDSLSHLLWFKERFAASDTDSSEEKSQVVGIWVEEFVLSTYLFFKLQEIIREYRLKLFNPYFNQV